MIILNQKTDIRKIKRMNLRQNCEKYPTFYTFPLATTRRQLAAGGRPSTRSPPGRLVEHNFERLVMQESFYMNLEAFIKIYYFFEFFTNFSPELQYFPPLFS